MLSIALYGVAFTLCLACLDLLRKSKNPLQQRSNKIIMVYVAVMLAVSTASVVSNIFLVIKAMFSPGTYDGDIHGVTGTVCIVLSNWGADGYLLRRCALLYGGTTVLYRRVILAVISIMGLMVFGAGVTCLSMALHYNATANLTIFGVTCTSLLVNLVITTLIITRIVSFIKTIRATLDRKHWSKYSHIVSIVIESAALIVVFCLAYVVLTLALPIKGRFPLESLSALVPMMSMTQIYVIAPCIIIYRVARGEAWSSDSGNGLNTSTDTESTSTTLRQPSMIRFTQKDIISDEMKDSD